MEQVSKNNKFRKTRSRLGQENPRKEVEPIAPARKLSHKQNIPEEYQVKIKLEEEEAILRPHHRRFDHPSLSIGQSTVVLCRSPL